MSGFRNKQRTLVNTVGIPGDGGSSPGTSRGGMPNIWPNNQTDPPTQVPQDITLRLLWPKFTHKYCIQKEIIKDKGEVPVSKIPSILTSLHLGDMHNQEQRIWFILENEEPRPLAAEFSKSGNMLKAAPDMPPNPWLFRSTWPACCLEASDLPSNPWLSTLIKKKIKFSSYIRKFRVEQLQSHIWLTSSSCMGKYLRNLRIFPHILGSLSSYMTLQLLHSEFPYIWGKFGFLFYQCRSTRPA